MHQAPGFPCALFCSGEWLRHNSDASRREKEDSCSTVIAREGGRSSIPEAALMKTMARGVLDTPHARGMTVLTSDRLPLLRLTGNCVFGQYFNP